MPAARTDGTRGFPAAWTHVPLSEWMIPAPELTGAVTSDSRQAGKELRLLLKWQFLHWADTEAAIGPGTAVANVLSTGLVCHGDPVLCMSIQWADILILYQQINKSLAVANGKIRKKRLKNRAARVLLAKRQLTLSLNIRLLERWKGLRI